MSKQLKCASLTGSCTICLDVYQTQLLLCCHLRDVNQAKTSLDSTSKILRQRGSHKIWAKIQEQKQMQPRPQVSDSTIRSRSTSIYIGRSNSRSTPKLRGIWPKIHMDHSLKGHFLFRIFAVLTFFSTAQTIWIYRNLDLILWENFICNCGSTGRKGSMSTWKKFLPFKLAGARYPQNWVTDSPSCFRLKIQNKKNNNSPNVTTAIRNKYPLWISMIFERNYSTIVRNRFLKSDPLCRRGSHILKWFNFRKNLPPQNNFTNCAFSFYTSWKDN